MTQSSLEHFDQQGKMLVISRQVMLAVVAAILVTSLLIFMLSAMGGVRYTLGRSNPLEHYGSLLPGQSASVLSRFGCQQDEGAANGNPRELKVSVCTNLPRDEFHLIQVRASQDSIREVRLFSDTMQPELLFAAWGKPDSMERSENRRSVTLWWDRGLYEATVTVLQDDHVARIIRLNMKT